MVLVLAGFADRIWILSAGFLSAFFSVASFIFAAGFQSRNIAEEFRPLFAYSGRFHMLAALVCLVIFFMAREQVRLSIVRRVIICAALAVDIVFAARFLVSY